jgi:hypothetical protein
VQLIGRISIAVQPAFQMVDKSRAMGSRVVHGGDSVCGQCKQTKHWQFSIPYSFVEKLSRAATLISS